MDFHKKTTKLTTFKYKPLDPSVKPSLKKETPTADILPLRGKRGKEVFVNPYLFPLNLFSFNEMQKSAEQEQGEARAKVDLEELKNKFINLLMRDGEKSKAYKQFKDSLNLLEERILSNSRKEKESKKHESLSKKGLTKTSLPSQVSVSLQKSHLKGVPTLERFLSKQLFQFYDLYNTKKENEGMDGKDHLFKKNALLRFVKKSPEKGTLLGNEDSYMKKNDFVSENQKKRDTNLRVLFSRNKRIEQNYYNDFLKSNTLYRAIENVKPTLELRKVRKGGTTYQVPAIVNHRRQERLAIKWIIESAEKRKKKNKTSFSDCLVYEILEAFNKTGQAFQRKEEQLKIAQFNRAYTRYRWW